MQIVSKVRSSNLLITKLKFLVPHSIYTCTSEHTRFILDFNYTKIHVFLKSPILACVVFHGEETGPPTSGKRLIFHNMHRQHPQLPLGRSSNKRISVKINIFGPHCLYTKHIFTTVITPSL